MSRIPWELRDRDLQEIFECCGKIAKWNAGGSSNSGKFAFLSFQDHAGLGIALMEVQGRELCGRAVNLKCEEAALDAVEVWKAALRKEARKAFPDKCRRAEKLGTDEQDPNGEWLADEEIDEVVKEHLLAQDRDLVNDRINKANEDYMVGEDYFNFTGDYGGP